MWEEASVEHDERVCAACHGKRLRPEALAVRFRDRCIDDLAQMSVVEAEQWSGALRLRARERDIGRDALTELRSRLRFLRQVGLGYLSLARSAPSLSGGEVNYRAYCPC